MTLFSIVASAWACNQRLLSHYSVISLLPYKGESIAVGADGFLDGIAQIADEGDSIQPCRYGRRCDNCYAW
jgi:hypothetical protein